LRYTFGEGHEVVNQAQRSGPLTIFNNRSGLIYYYTTVLDTEELVDEGSFAKSGVNGTEQINGTVFEYCSAVPDPAGTQDVVDAELRFYDQTIPFQGVTGWVDANNRNEKCGYNIPGLPGGTAAGGLQCWVITLNLNGGFECTLPQEQAVGSMDNFGWSLMYGDANSSGLSGPVYGATSGYGTVDGFEYYLLTQPLGSEYMGNYWFGGGSHTQANFLLDLEGNPTDTSAYYSANPGVADTIDLQATDEIRVNQVGSWTITNPTAGQSYALIASTMTADAPALAGGNAHLLVAWMTNPLLPAPFVMPGGSYSQNLPGALPPTINVQAAEYAGALTPGNIGAMSNGLTHSN